MQKKAPQWELLNRRRFDITEQHAELEHVDVRPGAAL
jgi:hypothetical protein